MSDLSVVACGFTTLPIYCTYTHLHSICFVYSLLLYVGDSLPAVHGGGGRVVAGLHIRRAARPYEGEYPRLPQAQSTVPRGEVRGKVIVIVIVIVMIL